LTTLDAMAIRVARSVRRRFERLRAPADLDDVAQDAAVGALEAIRAGRLDAGRPAWGYLATAARAEAGLAASRALSVLSISEHEAVNARKYQARVTTVTNDEGEEESIFDRMPSPFPSPVEVLEQRRAAPAEDARRRRRERLIETWFRELDREDAHALALLFGVGVDAAPGGVDEVAFRTGIPRANVLRAVQRFKKRAEQDRARATA
jgi:RNA polymerase sigma factor (sigma-70 family)